MKKIVLLFLIPMNCVGQNTIGLPEVINYTKKTYFAGLQNWDIKQDKNNIIYVANNEGMLTYDGKFWNLYPLPNKTIVHSVAVGENNIVYVGGQDEMGYYAPGSNGTLEYHSLVKMLQPKDRSFGDVWDIEVLKKDVYFRTNQKIYKLTNNSIAVYNAPQEWTFMGRCRDQLYAHDLKTGLMLMKNNVWQPMYTKENLVTNDPVTSILPVAKDSILVTTLKSGIYLGTQRELKKLNFPLFGTIAGDRIYNATLLANNWIGLATNNAGVFIVDLNGQLIQRLSAKEGLQNNNILCIFLDNQSNLWLGLNNGIDFVAYNSAIKHINPSTIGGSGYTMLVSGNNLYAGTSAGLFYTALQKGQDMSFSKGSFLPVANTDGQVWSLAEINGQILSGHHEGAYMINNFRAVPIISRTGFWNFEPFSSVFPTERVLSGNYLGLTFLNFKNNSFAEAESIPDFKETSRFIKIDKLGNIWVSHPYHGVYKLTETDSGKYKITHFTGSNGLPSVLNNHIYKIKNEVVVATEKGIYNYNAGKDIFEPSPFYADFLGQQSIRYLKEDIDGNIWFIHEKQLGVIDLSTPKKTVIYFPELNNKLLSGFEFIYPLNRQNIFVGGENGFFHINYDKYKKNIPELLIGIRTVKIADSKDSVLFGGFFTDKENSWKNNISNKWKSIIFEFSSPLFGQQENLEYSYRLSNYTNEWSEWNAKTNKEYSNLPAGKYVFQVKARNNLGNESKVVSYSFKILPPWYKSRWANIIYFLIAGAGFYLLVKWQQRKFETQQIKYEEEQKKLQYLHQLEIDKAENELIALRNEKLEAEINFKNTELASSAMHLVQKGELLTSMKSDLNQIMKEVKNQEAASELKKLVKTLGEDDKMDKDWEHFTQHFDKVHNDFVEKLKEKHPNVTGNEIKLCAYLRMNLSTKEIAQLMNISARGVEISRYRLRKKLKLETKDNLFKYLIDI